MDHAYKRLGIPSIKLNGPGARGNPDRLFLLGAGQVLFVEFKRPGGKVTPLQAHIHQSLRDRGYRVFVCFSVVDAIEVIRLESQRAAQYV